MPNEREAASVTPPDHHIFTAIVGIYEFLVGFRREVYHTIGPKIYIVVTVTSGVAFNCIQCNILHGTFGVFYDDRYQFVGMRVCLNEENGQAHVHIPHSHTRARIQVKR